MTNAKIVTKRFITCPGCGEYDHPIEFMLDGTERTFGPWDCRVNDCLTQISGVVHPNGVVELEFMTNPKPRGFALLKLRDLYLVLRESYGRIERDHADYFYHSHQCPTNLLQDVVGMYGPNGSSDPHGLIRYVAGIDDTPETRAALKDKFGCAPSLRDVMKLFNTDGEPIETDWPEANGGLIPWLAEMRREEDKKS